MFGLFKEENKYIDLKEFADIRKNMKTNYTNNDIVDYCCEIFVKNFKKMEKYEANQIKEHFSKCKQSYEYYVIINLEDVTKKFIGITQLEILKILANEDKHFKNNLKLLFRQLMTEKVLNELTTQIEFNMSNIENVIHNYEQKINSYVCEYIKISFIMYFKY